MSSISPAATASTVSNSSATSSPGQGAPLTINGLVSGLNTQQIIQGLLAVDQQRITDIRNQETHVQEVQSAYKGIESQLLTLQGDMTKLGKSQNGTFDARTATSSDTSVVGAAAGASATPGVYNLRINRLATALQVDSQGFASPTSAITAGTLQLATNGGAVTDITIDSSNSTLQGLANAINESGAPVTASIINDGSDANGYRLLLTSNATGTSNAVSITNNLGASTANATMPDFNAGNVTGPVVLDTGYTGSATPTANSGTGTYTGTTDNNYTFTVVAGGTVGTDNNIQVSYTDTSGAHTGTLTLSSSDVNTVQNVAQGLQLQFNAGTLVTGQSFRVGQTAANVQDATDASVTLGSGTRALTITSATNQVSNLIPGVTLQLKKPTETTPVSVTVANDVTGAQKAIDQFVTDYNGLMQFIDQQTSFDPSSKTAGLLLGDSRASGIENQIRSAVENVVSGANPQMNNLTDLGITTDINGQLVVDDNKLSSVLSGGVAGVTMSDVKQLFAMTGAATNPGIVFIAGSNETKPSLTPYTVNVTQAAQQASVTATNPLANQIAIDGNTNALALTVDGQAASVTLAAGTYTRQALAQMVQAASNGNSTLAGRQVSVAVQGNSLAITSNSYGSASQVTIGSSSANTPLGFSGSENNRGVNVVGQFVVNGITEPAGGNGQFLIGNVSNANTSGLEVRVTLTPAQVGAGTQASLTVSSGVANQLNDALNTLLDPVTGRLKSIDDGFTQTIAGDNTDIASETALMQEKQQSLLAQFNAMEQTLAQLQSVSSLISSNALALPNSQPSSNQSKTR
jgi:flagellar hook-associated protein 2